MSCKRLVAGFPIRFCTMISWLRHLIGWFISVFRSREDLILENLALRQRLLALRARRPRRRVSALQKLFWIVLRRLWAGWKKPLILVTPRTVVGWHRGGVACIGGSSPECISRARRSKSRHMQSSLT